MAGDTKPDDGTKERREIADIRALDARLSGASYAVIQRMNEYKTRTDAQGAESGALVLRTPSSGRYYGKPGPGKAPFVAVGDVIEIPAAPPVDAAYKSAIALRAKAHLDYWKKAAPRGSMPTVILVLTPLPKV